MSGRCPECGTPVALSAQTDALQFSDPRWVSRLARGAMLLFVATECSIYLYAGLLGQMILEWPIPLASWIQLAEWIFIAGGIWLVTEPDPAQPQAHAGQRNFLRTTTIFIAGFRLLLFVGVISRLFNHMRLILGILWMMVNLVLIGVEYYKLGYLAGLARRIPAERLERRARLLRRLNTATWGAITVAIVLFDIAMFTRSQRVFEYLSMLARVSSTLGAIMLILWIVTAFFYLNLRRALAAQAALARQIWSDADAVRPAPA
jgi:hypothetical protein